MHTAVLRLHCKDSQILKKSLEPDVKNDENTKTDLKAGKNFLQVTVRSKKINHLKAVVNSYIAFVDMFERAEI